MWMDGWVMSMCTQDLQKGCTKLLSLPDNDIKKLNFSPSAKKKNATSQRLQPQSDRIMNTHKNQLKTLRTDLSWDHFNSSLQAKAHI